MWYWFVKFTISLPFILISQYLLYKSIRDGGFQAAVEREFAGGEIATPHVPPPGFLQNFSNYADQFVNTFAIFALACGLLTVLFPRLRASYIERRHNLMTPPTLNSLSEIGEFISRHAPGLAVKANLHRPGRIYIYPSGFRKATLAIFSGFMILWKVDREAAEAVLLHEIAHQQRGDALFMGPGSLLERSIKIALLLFVVFTVLPTVLLSAGYTFENTRSMLQLRELQFVTGHPGAVDLRPLPALLWGIIMLIVSNLLGILLKCAGFSTMILVAFAQPVAGMWAAELNADHLVAGQLKYREGLLRVLSAKENRVGWRRRLMFRLSHPPDGLRRFLLRHGQSYATCLMLLIYPAAFLVEGALVLAYYISSYAMLAGSSLSMSYVGGSDTGMGIPDFWRGLAVYTSQSFTSHAPVWLYAALMLLIWPFVMRRWERLFKRGSGITPLAVQSETPTPDTATLISTLPRRRIKYHFVSAAFCAAVFLFMLAGHYFFSLVVFNHSSRG
jgi:hypothetical protein